MIRHIMFLGFIGLFTFSSFAQCVASLDTKQRVITTCQFPYSDIKNPIKLPRSQAIYLGSEYISFPIWQIGTVKLGSTNREVFCKIAYNLVSQEVKCQLDTISSQETLIIPDIFTINGVKFIKCINQTSAITPSFYGMVLYDGRTKLLRKTQRKLQVTEPTDSYQKAEEFNGYYENLTSYFIQRADERLVPINLTKKSVLSALGDNSERLASRFTAKNISVDELVNALKYYDSQQEE